MKWSESQYNEFKKSKKTWMEKLIKKYENDPEFQEISNQLEKDEKESKLQGKIVKYCKDKGFPCLSFRQSRKAKGFLTPGWPDLIIVLPYGRVEFIEFKSKKGELRKEQRKLARMFSFLGHKIHKVKTYKLAKDIIEGRV